MPKIIVKCGYYKTAQRHGDVGGLLRYIASRPGVESVVKSSYEKTPTQKQLELIRSIVSEQEKAKSLAEYKEYENKPSRGSASEFISAAFENNPNLLTSEFFLRYIATRPRADKRDKEHGLFSGDNEVDLDKAMTDIRHFDGNLFSIIVSLKREDAERLGYNNANSWRDMVRDKIDQVAQNYDIPMQDLVWYGAFHNEGHHPHIHLLLYSKNKERPGFIKKKKIDELRRIFGTEIFKDELKTIYNSKTVARNRLTNRMRKRFHEIADRAVRGLYLNENFLNRLLELASRLDACGGKHQYGYLPKSVKGLVDQIVDEVSNEKDVEKLYDLWYQEKCGIWASYSDTPPEKKPLSKEDEFKAIRNALIQEVDKLREEMRDGDQKNNPPSNSPSSRTPQTHATPASSSSNGTSSSNGSAPSRNSVGQTQKRHPSRQHLASRALSFANSLRRIFIDRYEQYGNDDEDIDKKLKQEIRAVKNGENIIM